MLIDHVCFMQESVVSDNLTGALIQCMVLKWLSTCEEILSISDMPWVVVIICFTSSPEFLMRLISQWRVCRVSELVCSSWRRIWGFNDSTVTAATRFFTSGKLNRCTVLEWWNAVHPKDIINAFHHLSYRESELWRTKRDLIIDFGAEKLAIGVLENKANFAPKEIVKRVLS